MEKRVIDIFNAVEKAEYVKIAQPFMLDGEIVKGAIEITIETVILIFSVEIYPPYPFQYHDFETIRFINKELITYDHVNEDGSICVHTPHSPEIASKIALDLDSLKQWIIRYVIKKEKDIHYEHIVIAPSGTGKNQALWFTDVNYQFGVGEFGAFHFSKLSTGNVKEDKVQTFILQDFEILGGKVESSWSKHYKNFNHYTGIYLFLGEPPVKNRRSAVRSWQELEPFVGQNFLKYLYNIKSKSKRNSSKLFELKLILGYYMTQKEIHWQAINVPTGNFPIYGHKIGNKSYQGRFLERPIDWMHTKNCSYKFFFGRGALTEKLTNSKILVIGIGAIGSMLCNTLVRGGCHNLFLNDHDVKEADNVCRSEYQFANGWVSKVFELKNQLILISPFAEIKRDEELTDIIKLYRSDKKWQTIIEKAFNSFDYIFDCTTDNDLAYIFSLLNIEPEVINLSITNHAKEMVCVFKQDQYKWLIEIFNSLKNDTTDVYNPTGCWSPTFKASYNDIAVMLQFAVKQINYNLSNNRPLRNFYLSTSDGEAFGIKLNQF